jgi:glycosyltransferase involved in cell wall biosynthesis
MRWRASEEGVTATTNARRVLMLLENAPYPQDDRVRREARTLVAAGYRVTVISRSTSGQPWRESLDGVHVYRFPRPRPGSGLVGYMWEYGYSMVMIFALSLFVLLREGFDVVHAHHPPDTFASIAAVYKLLGKRYVLDHHDLAPELYFARFSDNGNLLVFRALAWLERFACRLADHVIATNQSYRTMEMQRGQVPAARISVVRNGPDLDELYSAPSEMAVRVTDKTTLGYVGMMGFQDGVDYLVRALQHLVNDLGRTDFVCVLVGAGDAMSYIRHLTREFGLDAYVSFTGWVYPQSVVARHLGGMDICLAPEPSNPYNDRSTAAKIMEYMALGKPIVAFDLPEHRISAQDAALYARPNDEMDFARKIALLMDNPQLCEEMGRKGKKRIEAELSWAHQAERLVRAYEALYEL